MDAPDVVVSLIGSHLHCGRSVLCWRRESREVGDGSERTDTTGSRVSGGVSVLENSHGRIGLTGAVEGGLLQFVLCGRGDRWGRQNEMRSTACRWVRCFDREDRPWQLRGRDANAITR